MQLGIARHVPKHPHYHCFTLAVSTCGLIILSILLVAVIYSERRMHVYIVLGTLGLFNDLRPLNTSPSNNHNNSWTPIGHHHTTANNHDNMFASNAPSYHYTRPAVTRPQVNAPLSAYHVVVPVPVSYRPRRPSPLSAELKLKPEPNPNREHKIRRVPVPAYHPHMPTIVPVRCNKPLPPLPI